MCCCSVSTCDARREASGYGTLRHHSCTICVVCRVAGSACRLADGGSALTVNSMTPSRQMPRSRSFASAVLRRSLQVAALLSVGAVLDVPRDLDAQGAVNGGAVETLPNANGQLRSPYPSLIPGMAPVPFTVGERLQYDVKFSFKSVGTGVMEVKDIVDVRGRPSWYTSFTIKGGIPFFRVDDRMESWFDVFTLSSRRFHQRISEGGYKRTRHYEMYPERAVFREGDKEEEPSVNSPLDDGSFLYYVRTIPLEVGKTYEVPRYFNPAANPVRITVVRRETIKVPAGEFKTVVLRPTFQSRGLFSEDGKAEVWISDDEYRFMVQMKTNLKIGSINLYLEKFTLPPASAPPR